VHKDEVLDRCFSAAHHRPTQTPISCVLSPQKAVTDCHDLMLLRRICRGPIWRIRIQSYHKRIDFL